MSFGYGPDEAPFLRNGRGPESMSVEAPHGASKAPLLSQTERLRDVASDGFASHGGTVEGGGFDAGDAGRARGPTPIASFTTAVVGLALLADYLLLTVVIPLLPDLLPDGHKDAWSSGVMFACKPGVQILVNPLAAFLADRVGGRLVMCVGLLTAAGATVVFMLVTSYEGLLVARCVQGFGSAAVMSGGMSFLTHQYPPDQRGSASGAAMGGIALGVVCGPSLGGSFYTIFGRNGPFVFVLAVVALDCLAQISLEVKIRRLNAALLDVGKGDSGGGEAVGFGRVLRDPTCLALFVVLTAANMTMAAIEPLVPLFLKQQYDFTAGQSALFFTIAPVAYLLATPTAGALSDRYPRWRVVTAGLLLGAVGMIVVWAGIFVVGEGLHSLNELTGCILLGATLLMAGMGIGFVDAPSMPLMADIVEWRGLKAMGEAAALVDIGQNLAFVLAPLASSALAAHFDIPKALACFGGIALLVSPICLCCLRQVGAKK